MRKYQIAVAVSTYSYSDGVGDCILTSFFQTMSAMTTVGFNTIDLSELNLFTILIITLVMFIGASPSGTGGGVKSTSVSAIYAFVKSQMRPHSTSISIPERLNLGENLTKIPIFARFRDV